MERYDAEQILSYGAGAYPSAFGRLQTDEVELMLRVWVDAFAAESGAEVFAAYRGMVQTCTFPPTVAEVRRQLEQNRRASKYRLAELRAARNAE